VAHRGTYVIGAVLLRDAADLPQGLFQTFSQRLKRLPETDAGHLYVGGGQHKMVDQVAKQFPSQRHIQIIHVRKVRLRPFSWRMSLFKDDLLLRAMQGFPAGDMPLEGAHLCRAVVLGMLLAQQGK